MDINRANMQALFIGYNKAFLAGYELADPKSKAFMMEFPSQTTINSYPMAKFFAGMKEWIGPRQLKHFSSEKLEVRNRTFEDSVEIDREEIEDNNYLNYSNAISEMARAAGLLWHDLAIEALLSNGKWLDGADFFGTARKYGKSAIVNKGTSALSESAFNTAYLTMQEYKDHNGKTLKSTPNLLVVGPKNRVNAFNIIKNQRILDAASKIAIENVNLNVVDILEVDELVGSYADHWYLMNTKGIFKPVAVQKRKEPSKLIRKDREEDDNVFFEKQLVYGVDGRGAGFLTLPHLCYASLV